MSIRGWWALLGLGVVLLVAGACANNDGNKGDDEPSAEPTASAVGTANDIDQRDDATPASGAAGGAAGGSTLNCGEEVQMHGTGYDRAARECLWQAYSAGGGAVFTTTLTTIEGDPILRHIDLVGSGQIEVTLDNTQDKFAAADDRVVATVTCTGMAITDDGQNDYAFELSGCDIEGGIIVV